MKYSFSPDVFNKSDFHLSKAIIGLEPISVNVVFLGMVLYIMIYTNYRDFSQERKEGGTIP